MVETANPSRSSDKTGHDSGGAPAAGAAEPAVPASLIEHVEVEVEALLGGNTISVARLGKLKTGEVLELDRQINEAVELRVNGKIIGRGEIVTVDDKFAVRITELG